MNRIQKKRVLITGASAGIGEACARRFAAEGAELILWARRSERLAELAASLRTEHGATVHTQQIDVRDRAAVFAAVDALAADDTVPHILVNNAGLASGLDAFQDSDPDDWDRMIDTNVTGLLNVTRALLPLMIERGRGHVINIGSIAGYTPYPRGNVYVATKFAVRALTDAINLDLLGTPIRMSSVDPGLAETEFSLVRFHGDAERAEQVYAGVQALSGDDVADTVLYVAGTPEHVNILHVVVMPVVQRNPYLVDRGGG